MIFDALQAERDAAYLERQTFLAAIVATGAKIDGTSRRRLLKDLSLSNERCELMRAGDWDGVVEHEFINSSLAAETMHDIMREAGWLTDAPDPAELEPDL